ncbi:DUF1080 domain-containing protein [Roseisolibacter sp. H3M3-2]|uniref:3-keto-disaccharide hydrolase n=1 Tax=Roseisolibacter sp. H3M3-2 TaxID=3031323 RepID=UPI0023DCE4C3|nr:DUF1080 domain-containing protein [Roseisolibacter sp. H3M3-2]MDF1502738.1 DUF1080 domain-containing protein [Roseisolibacter sp. H3M3-2]
MSRPPLPVVALAALALARPAAAQPRGEDPPVVGRWDLKVAQPDGSTAPSWFEVTRSGYTALVGRFVHNVGSARPIGKVEWADGTFRFAVPPQWEQGDGDLRVEGRVDGAALRGTFTLPDGSRREWTATRAPTMRRAAAPRWGTPVPLFNGRDLAGWTTQGGGESKWAARGGVLVNAASGANLMTTRTFDDFKLSLEFRVPEKGNSGVYLRGRHEVQVEDSGTNPELQSVNVGGVYGFLVPSENASRRPGEWQRFDITLVGRRVTVVLNGRSVVADQVIPGPTGGAIDADEGAPGPILLQGDHTAVEFRNIVVTPAVTSTSVRK